MRQRQDIIQKVAEAMHERGYTSPYEEQPHFYRENLEAQADAAMDALKEMGLLSTYDIES